MIKELINPAFFTKYPPEKTPSKVMRTPNILLAFAMLFPNMQLMLLIPPIPIKAKYLVLVYGFYEIWSEFNRMPGDNVAHLAHLGGMLIAYIILRYWKNKYGTYY